jgi:Xaa-Pro dipeptidase
MRVTSINFQIGSFDSRPMEETMLFNRVRANRIMEQEGFEGLLATTNENVTYLTDHPGDHWFIRATVVFALVAHGDGQPVLVAPASHVTSTTPKEIDLAVYGGIPLVISDKGTSNEDDMALLRLRSRLQPSTDSMQALYSAVRMLGLGESRIAVDERGFTRQQFAALEGEFPKAEFIDGYEVFRRIRMVKTREEVERLLGAAQIAENGLKKAVEILQSGVTEYELKNVFNTGVAQAGGVPVFSVICSGHRSAHTNTTPSDRRIKAGDVVRFDVGARYRFYPSDIARTFVVGEPTSRQIQCWDAIVAAQQAALEVMRPGIRAAQIFKVAQETAHNMGLPLFKRHHVGHGIGIDLYDMPILKPENKTEIEEDMVLCVETPYYEVGFAGFQIEDMVVVGSKGVKKLSTLSPQLANPP